MLNTSGWAFSIASNKTMKYGLRRTISVNWPQAVLQVRFVDAAQPVETESLEDI